MLGDIGGERGIAIRLANSIDYHLSNQGNNDPTTVEPSRFWERVEARTGTANTRWIEQTPQRCGMEVLRPDLRNGNPSITAARERVVNRLDERLKPLARRVIDGDFSAH